MAKKKKVGLDEENKIYLVRRKICRWMICTFVFSLLIISSVSIAFFFIFLNVTLSMSIRNIFIAHTHSIVGDIL